MVVAVLRAITWGTAAAAVTSAALLTASSGGLPRIASITGDLNRGRALATPTPQAAADTSARSALPAAPGQTGAR